MDGGEGAWPDGSAGEWCVVRTRSRQEKILARDLRAKGLSLFLPLTRVTRSYAGRAANVEVPLFPGYLFLCCRPQVARAADEAKRAAEVIPVPERERLDGELRNLHLALNVHNGPLIPSPCPRQGLRAEVRAGPLRGLRGVIESPDRRERVILQVQVLGQAVSVEVDPSLVVVLE